MDEHPPLVLARKKRIKRQILILDVLAILIIAFVVVQLFFNFYTLYTWSVSGGGVDAACKNTICLNVMPLRVGIQEAGFITLDVFLLTCLFFVFAHRYDLKHNKL